MFHNANTIIQKITRQPHGVHSPFAYSFLKKVVFVKEGSNNSNRFARLLGRIFNEINPDTVLVAGSPSPIIMEELERVTAQSSLMSIPVLDETVSKTIKKLGTVDLAFFSNTLSDSELLDFYGIVSEQCNSKSVLIIDGIAKSKSGNRALAKMTGNDKATLVLDFYGFGIIFYNPKLSKQIIKVGY